jgi:hypothetical protein
MVSGSSSSYLHFPRNRQILSMLDVLLQGELDSGCDDTEYELCVESNSMINLRHPDLRECSVMTLSVHIYNYICSVDMPSLNRNKSPCRPYICLS